jgi:hypothetical protein
MQETPNTTTLHQWNRVNSLTPLKSRVDGRSGSSNLAGQLVILPNRLAGRRKPAEPARTLAPFPAPMCVVAPVRRAVPLLPNENEDFLITGMTRSLDRRLLALNLPEDATPAAARRPRPQRVAVMPSTQPQIA